MNSGYYHFKKPLNTMEEKKNQHTPGPWFIKMTGDGKEYLINDGYVGSVHSDDIDEDESGANASLICASPDLLGACQAVLNDKINTTIAKEMVRIAVEKATKK